MLIGNFFSKYIVLLKCELYVVGEKCGEVCEIKLFVFD